MKKIYLFSIIVILSFNACQKSKFEQDLADIPMEIRIHRLDQALFAKPAPTPDALLSGFNPFFELYSYHILRLGNPKDSLFPVYLNRFVNDATIREVKQTTDKEFAQLDFLQTELEDLFRYLTFYDSLFVQPQVYTYISGFNQSVVTDSLLVGISLEKYLGRNCKFYDYLEIPMYLRTRMVPERISLDVAEALGRMSYVKEMQKADLLASMVYEGKLMYFMRSVLPTVADTLLMNYSAKEMEWLQANEGAMWTYFIEHKKLFETSAIEIRKFTGDAPFTNAFGNNSAPRAGNFIGSRIVFQYMEKNPNVSLMQLLTENDAQMILQKAQYNPK